MTSTNQHVPAALDLCGQNRLNLGQLADRKPPPTITSRLRQACRAGRQGGAR
jgi:hypothetical protein